LKTLKILAGAVGFFLFSLISPPVPAAVTPDDASGSGLVLTLPGSGSPSNSSFPENLAAAQSLFLPLVLKSLPLPSSLLVVLINNFLLFVPAP
jgi:hypothetical protein